MTRFWHPFATMGPFQDRELVLIKGEGSTITDREGRSYLDAAAGLWFCNVGHGRTQIAEAMAAQASVLASCSCFDDTCNEPVLRLADRIAARAPLDDPRVFFTSGGSDAVDTAAKLARRYWDEIGQPGKQIIVSREGSYHGMHAFGTSLAGIEANRQGVGKLVPDTVRVPKLDAGALAATIDQLGPDRVAAFFVEPVINAGVWPPDQDYLARARQVCAERDVLFVADEVVTGFGRLGRWFGSERYGVRPDMLLFAKGVTSGYLPLGGVIASARVAEPFWQGESGAMFRHGYTYSGHATACAAAHANLDLIESEGLVERVADLEEHFRQALTALLDAPGVTAVRSAGLAAAVQTDPQLAAADPQFPRKAVLAAREHGVLTRMLSGFAFQVSPPFVTAESEIDQIAGGLRGALRQVVQRPAALA